ncbi:MAG: hypothetical protein F6K53_43410, partial [Moorea sp. SIO4A1]|nr:hypothetical protein [Moorena sp. SIO4A1]
SILPTEKISDSPSLTHPTQLLPAPCSLFPIPYSLFPIPCSLLNTNHN